ncbi:MAG: galactose oxidase-like domain-containing protein, partial [Actinomycetota bacterium]
LVGAGGGDPSLNPPTGGADAIHLFSPPYLNRGLRPEIETLSTATLQRGASFTLKLRFGQLLTDVVLIGARACAGYSDGGPQRFARLRFTVRKGMVRVAAPKKTDPLPPGHYLLFALVDDVPSEGRMVVLG